MTDQPDEDGAGREVCYTIDTEKPLRLAMAEAEATYLAKTLEAAQGNRREGAQRAGVPYETFCRKVKKHGLRIQFVGIKVVQA